MPLYIKSIYISYEFIYEPSQFIWFGAYLFQSKLIMLIIFNIDPAHLQYIYIFLYKIRCVFQSVLPIIITQNYIPNFELILTYVFLYYLINLINFTVYNL